MLARRQMRCVALICWGLGAAHCHHLRFAKPHAAVRFDGRFLFAPGPTPQAHFAWSHSGLTARFEGTRLAVALREVAPTAAPGAAPAKHHNVFAVHLDAQPPFVVTLRPDGSPYLLATGLTPGPHTVSLVKRTEALVGEVIFSGFDFGPGGKLLPAPPPATRRLEFVGDSISAGYGNEGSNQSCPFTDATENSELAYGPVTARALGADASVIAWSGKGVLRNADNSQDDLLGTLYARLLPQRCELLRGPPQPAVDAVVLNAGTNDFSSGVPPKAAFMAAYRALVMQLRARNPTAHIVCTLGPMLSDNYPRGNLRLSLARLYILEVVAQLQAQGERRLGFLEFPMQDGHLGYGCDWHPSAATHAAMAIQLETYLRDALHW